MNADNSWFPELRMIVQDKVYELHLTYDSDSFVWIAKAEYRLSEMCTVSNMDWEASETTIERVVEALSIVIENSPLDGGYGITPEELDELAGRKEDSDAVCQDDQDAHRD